MAVGLIFGKKTMHLEIFAFVAGFINQISSDKFASTIGGYSEWGSGAWGENGRPFRQEGRRRRE